MEQIAWILGGSQIFWSAVVLGLGCITAVCLYLALYLPKGKNVPAAAVSVPVAMALSLVLARLLHWYCRTDSYASLKAAMTEISTGGYALSGVFAGCLLVAVLLRVCRVSRNLPEMLDCMAIAGAAGIAVGRLSFFFNNADRGVIVEGALGLPLAYPVINPVSGVPELRLATFFLQSLTAGAIFLGLLAFWLLGQRRKDLPDGDVTILFALFYGAGQVLLDSTRYDSLYFRSNGFVSIVQVFGAGAILLAVVFFSARMVSAGGWKKWHIPLWLLTAALFGLAGYMEYFVQRRGHMAAFAYSVMGGALLGIGVLTLIFRTLAVKVERHWGNRAERICAEGAPEEKNMQ